VSHKRTCTLCSPKQHTEPHQQRCGSHHQEKPVIPVIIGVILTPIALIIRVTINDAIRTLIDVLRRR
jgi:hypothetical protein